MVKYKEVYFNFIIILGFLKNSRKSFKISIKISKWIYVSILKHITFTKYDKKYFKISMNF